ncbi:MAG: histidine--tRNA ligase [Thermodesulfobacteriota bacterium]
MIKLIKGFRDLLPGEIELWQHVEAVARRTFSDFCFSEIRLPLLETTELFARSIGADTDIVEKEMYTFEDRGGDMITLRPEATAGVVRSYIEHGFGASDPVQKLFTIGPMFRRERPQKGRFRQFSQINAEFFGAAEPQADVLVLFMATAFFSRLRVPDIAIHLNSLGCPDCRPAYRETLLAFLSERKDRLCENCLRRYVQNPLRVLDCKAQGCRELTDGAPSIADHLCPACRQHFEFVKKGLSDLGAGFVLDPRLVRGLDYYTRTTFEVQTTSLGAQNAVAGGGRYDGLVKALGGPDTPAVGFAVGMDRLVELLKGNDYGLSRGPAVYLACLGDAAREKGFLLLAALCRAGVAAEMDFGARSMKSLMKRADKTRARKAIILGEDELARGVAVVRNLSDKSQEEVSLDRIVAYFSEATSL